jgi:hypothetical protein
MAPEFLTSMEHADKVVLLLNATSAADQFTQKVVRTNGFHLSG